ncbi:unnamed protein product [Bursaphelenchus xylophilus]|uniref:Ribosomal RNA-processing protein 42 n=1 Tax=Bursaphelenchus xylophilus TaxID=6326 RepID=A0A1I7SSK5_BURXY|nr:unnamed protein product [Bursaphelenchus xylophilus]CAG9097456.1 unnamed protein product [Bursaphelenchus xylophilus]
MTDQKDYRTKIPRIKLSSYERIHILEGFNEEIRTDGRGLREFRPIGIELGVIPHVDGSCRLKAGNVDLVVGIRGELETVIDTEMNSDSPPPLRLEFSVELSPNSDLRFLGKEPIDLAEQIKTALAKAYDNDEALPQLKDLRLTKRLAWNIFADIEVLSYDGNVIDFAGMALKAALTDFKVPKMRVLSDVVDGLGAEMDGVEFPTEVEFITLDTKRCPLFCTVNVINDMLALDVTEEEDCCVVSAVCIAIILPENDPEDYLVTYAATVHRGTMELSTTRELYKFAYKTIKRLNVDLETFIQLEKTTKQIRMAELVF